MMFHHDPTPGRLVCRCGVWIEVRTLPNGGESRLYRDHAHRCVEAIHMRHAEEAMAEPEILVPPTSAKPELKKVVGRIGRRA